MLPAFEGISMRSMTKILMAAALALGFTGAALADDPSDERSRGDTRSPDGRTQDETWGDPQDGRDPQNGRDPGDWSGGRGSDGRGSDGRGYGQGRSNGRGYGRGTDRGDRCSRRRNDRGYSGRGPSGRGYGGRGYGSVTPWEQMRIREARRQLRRVEWLAMRDGFVAPWERMRIHQARQRLAWLVQRSYMNGGSW